MVFTVRVVSRSCGETDIHASDNGMLLTYSLALWGNPAFRGRRTDSVKIGETGSRSRRALGTHDARKREWEGSLSRKVSSRSF